MRSVLTLLAIALFSAGVTACGGVSKGTGSVSQTSSGAVASSSTPVATAPSVASTQPNLKRDRDNDYDNSSNSYYDKDDSVILGYGHAAGAADRQAVAAVVKRYYAAAAAGDGAKGCSLIYSIYAETIPENYGRPPAGPPALRGKTCAEVMSKVFKQRQPQLAADSATLKVTGARLEGNRGWALMSFKTMPARSILVHRERGAWKIYALLDSELP
jgi:hypothetical protein